MPSSLDQQHYETVIVGAGMAGLAAGIRLALAGKNVIILERHNASGGLNSFYSQDRILLAHGHWFNFAALFFSTRCIY